MIESQLSLSQPAATQSASPTKGSHAGEAATLEEAKSAVEQAVLVGASQLALFDKN